MKNSLLALALFFSFLAHGEGDVPLLDARRLTDAPKILENLSPDANPGKGKITFKHGDVTENIELGIANGTYGMGMIVYSDALPEGLQRDFPKTHLIQILLGNNGPQSSSLIAQFATLILTSKKIPSGHQVFSSILPGERTTKIDHTALILFSSPSTPKERTDEEKLRGAYLAQSGVLAVDALGKPETVDVRNGTGRVRFKRQTFRIDFNSLLITPFNPQPGDLKGQIEVPVYWPMGKPAVDLVRETVGGHLSALFSPKIQATPVAPPPKK